MAQVIRFGPKRQPLLSARNLVLLLAVGAAVFALGASYRDQFGELTASYKPEARTPSQPVANSGPTVVKLGVPAPAPLDGPIDARRITVVDGDTIRVEAVTDARVLLLAGRPISEPVFWHGPFVMNSREEIVQAFDDFQSGRF